MWDALISFFSWPLDTWKEGHPVMAVFIGLLVLAITVFVAWLVFMPLRWLYRKLRWLVLRRHCQHCNGWTLDTGSGQFNGCASGNPCCFACTMGHRADAEPQYPCPVDRVIMRKIVDGELIYDFCPNCQHYILHEDELAALRQRSYQKGHSSGNASGLTTGMLYGMAINQN
jgi:hypothetical protein